MIYLAMIAAVVGAFFFFSSVRFMEESDLFELIGSVFQRGAKPLGQPASTPPPPPAREARCPKCGASVKPSAKFCENCGANMK